MAGRQEKSSNGSISLYRTLQSSLSGRSLMSIIVIKQLIFCGLHVHCPIFVAHFSVTHIFRLDDKPNGFLFFSRSLPQSCVVFLLSSGRPQSHGEKDFC